MTIFHITNRGVEKRKIFLDDKDRLRFVHSLTDLNNKNDSLFSYKDRRKMETATGIENDKEPLVDILAWCLMPNHFHLLVNEKIKAGAGKFSKKITGGYTQYFNLRRKRSGFLFQGKTKILSVNNDPYFLYIPYYIFTNPLKLKQSDWKKVGVKKPAKMLEFIENYKWSSLQDTIGKNNFPEIINKKLFFKLFNSNAKELRKDIKNWLSN